MKLDSQEIDGNCYSRLKKIRTKRKHGENSRIMSTQRQTGTAVLLVTG
jgi:hypothetical protein